MAAKKKKTGRGGARPGSGRPSLLEDRVRFMVHLERADLEALQKQADEAEVSVGQVIRDILSRSLRRRRH
jgi:hypothetical protein